MKKIGHHRSRKLAERHARDAGMVIVDRRNRKGHKSKRGHTFLFADKLMWRYTVAGLVKKNKKREDKTSPSLMVRATTWAKTKAKIKIEETREAMMKALQAALNRKKYYPFSQRWFSVNEEMEQVEYDEKLIEKVNTGT